jgi:hypothetical protein
MVAARDKRFDFNTADERGDRLDLVSLAKPQGGVNAMAEHFPNAKAVEGVTDNGDAAARPVPTVRHDHRPREAYRPLAVRPQTDRIPTREHSERATRAE